MISTVLYVTKKRTDEGCSNWWFPSLPRGGVVGLGLAILLLLLAFLI
jgi:hypothetical protein